MTIEIDEKKALELLARAVDEKGEDYIYQPHPGQGTGCVYVLDGSPSCIVGHVVNYIKPELIPRIGAWERREVEDYETHEGHHVGGTLDDEYSPWSGTGASELLPMLDEDGIEFTPGAIKLLKEAQTLQDAGTPWGESVRKAREYVRV